MESILNNPELQKYRRSYEPGQTIFWEGDDSTDLHLLVAGELNVLKGDKVIAHMDAPGTIFGEMSFLLGGKRTATVKTLSRAEVLSVPQEDIQDLRKQYPDITEEISRILAERLDHASQVVYGLRQFCDQLPDAVVLTDQEGRIISMNHAAKILYGYDFSQIHGQRLEEIYEEPNTFRVLEQAARSGKEVREKALAIRHPQKGRRWVSLSMNSLYDARENFKGLLALGRDVTSSRNARKRFLRTMLLLVPAMLLVGGYLGLQALDIPWLGRERAQVESGKHQLQTRLAKDFFMLKAQLLDYYEPPDRKASHGKLLNFIKMQDKNNPPYTAIVLLDPEKRVFDAAVLKGKNDADGMIGNTYARLNFEGRPDSLHKLLSLYRREVGQSSSYQVLEMAFEVKRKGQTLGWIVFQMDMDLLKANKEVNEDTLKNFKFQEP